MMKRLFSVAGGLILAFSVSSVFAQNTQTTTTTTTQTTKSVQNSDGSWTVIEYPANKEVTVELTPTNIVPGAKGLAKIKRLSDQTTVSLDVSGLTGDINSYNLYAVDPLGKVTMLGPVTVSNGIATQTFTTPLDKFMLVLSPDANLTTIGSDTRVAFRSAVPQGFAVVPVAHSGPTDNAAVGERVAATTTPTTGSAYTVPMLGIPSFRKGTDTHLRVKFPTLGGSRANIFLEPRKDGPTQIKMRFHSLKRAPAGKRLVLWAVGPDNTYTRLGQVINTGRRNEAQIQTETALPDFGLFVTVEESNEPPHPSGPIYATVITENSR